MAANETAFKCPGSDGPDDLFREAQAQFLSSLSGREQSYFSTCDTVQKLIADVKSFGAFQKDHRKWSRCQQRIEAFSDQLQPYFEILNIVVQSQPQWTGIAWGAFRLVLQVGRTSES
jgi:uncharacterized FlgJ-related protein